MYSTRQRCIATAYGIVCHTAFILGIAAMIAAIYTGLAIGAGPFTGTSAVAADATLLAQFPLIHSLALSARGRKALGHMAPLGLGADLSTTIYAIIASVQLLATFCLWSPSGVTLWAPHGLLREVLTGVYASAWLFLLKTMADASLPVQTGYLGWGAVARNRRPQLPAFSRRGTFAYVRQPIYVAFALTLWTAPTWTLDRLVLTVAWTAYCLLGPLLKEERYLGYYGEAFRTYQQTVPYWLPRRHPDGRLRPTADPRRARRP